VNVSLTPCPAPAIREEGDSYVADATVTARR